MYMYYNYVSVDTVLYKYAHYYDTVVTMLSH